MPYFVGTMLTAAAVALAAAAPPAAAQSLRDRLNAAKEELQRGAEKLKEAAAGQAGGSSEPAARPRNCGALGAGCVDGARDLAVCMGRTVGYQSELVIAKLQPKLAAQSGPPRAQLEEDLRALDAATRPPYEFKAPDPKQKYRHWQWMSPQEQHEVNTKVVAYDEKVREECHAKHSGFGARR
jgi:hypothetical protein